MISHANTSSTDPDIQQRYAQFPLQPKNEGKADAPSADDSWPAVRLRARQKSEASAEWQLSAAEAHLSGEKMGVSEGHSQQGSAPPTTAPDSEPLTMGEAVFVGDIDAIHSLVAAGAAVNETDYDGNIWLHLACTRTSAEVLRALLSLGADVNHADDSGRTALHFACESGSAEMIRTLLDSGADIHRQTNRGRTPLHFAARSGDGDATEVLLSRGADPMIRDKRRSTSLHHAAKSGNVDAITTLLKKHPAMIHVRDKAGLTALEWATAKKQVKAIELLMANGADPN